MKCKKCGESNTATSIVKPYKTYCLTCNIEVEGKSEIANIFESMEGWEY